MSEKAETAIAKQFTLITKNVFVDTCVHYGSSFSYSSGDFARLAALAEAEMVKVFDTPIDVREIRRNINEYAAILHA